MKKPLELSFAWLLCLCFIFDTPSYAAPSSWQQLVYQSDSLVSQNKPVAAERFLLEALKAAQVQKRPEAILEVYKKLALQARNEKWLNKFVDYEHASLNIYHSMPRPDKAKEAEVYCDLGNFYYEEKSYALAAENLQLCYKFVQPLCSENSVTTVKLEECLADCYEKLSNKEKADAWKKLLSTHSRNAIEMIQRRIKSIWKREKWPSSMHATAFFKINGSGDFFDIKIEKSSQEASFYNSCMEAIKATNLKPMQSWQYYAPPVKVEFDFNYNFGQRIASGARPGEANDVAPSGRTGGLIQSARQSPYGENAELAVLKGMNKINAEINRLITQFIAIDIDKTTISLPAALQAVALCEQYINIGQFNKADDLIQGILQRPGVKQSEGEIYILLQAESGCILLKKQNLADSIKAFKLATESPLFEKIMLLSERQRFLKSYGDALFKQGMESEANAIYAKLTALNK